ncbi:MAG TPA: hypothetical protein HPP56_07930 [Nitrospirae bacterium]|nr:hypothetical protein [Nitrospirota bacterium]
MGKGLRYKLEHMGDYFVEMISCTIEAGETAAKGIILTYDMKQLKREREILLKRLGMQMVKDKRENINVDEDETIKDLIAQLDDVEKRLKDCKEAREQTFKCKKTDSCQQEMNLSQGS